MPNEVIQFIEQEDDNLCMMEGIEFESQDTRMLYWECRLRVINQRISGEFDNYGYSQLYKTDFKRLRKIIKKRIKEQKNIAILEINNSIEEREHNYCIAIRNQIGTEGEEYNYFKCRTDLRNLREKNKNSSDLSNEYLIKFFEYTDTEATPKSDTTTINKECIKYASNDKKLKQCQKAFSNINKCYEKVDEQLLQRNIDDKIYCTKSSLEKYPDDLVKFNNTSANTLGPKMDKLNIVELREKEFQKCYNERSKKMAEYRKFLENQCNTENLKKLNEKN